MANVKVTVYLHIGLVNKVHFNRFRLYAYGCTHPVKTKLKLKTGKLLSDKICAFKVPFMP